ncbi:MAG: cache domain-containing protein [Roseobacter sp.]
MTMEAHATDAAGMGFGARLSKKVKRVRLSLGLVLALCLAGLQFVAVSIVVFSSFITSEKVLLEHARNLLSDVGTNTIEHSRGFLKPARGAAELATRLAESQVIASDNFFVLEKLLFQQLQIAPQFSGLFYGDRSGSFVFVMRTSDEPGPFRTKVVRRDGDLRETTLIWRDDDYSIIEEKPDPTDTYDPRNRLWYQDASTELKSIWTDPYIFFTSQKPGITAASPVFGSDGSLQGVVGVDIAIDAISEFLSRLNIGDNGTALIVNKNGEVIAHPEPDLIRKRAEDGSFRFVTIDEIDDPVAQAAFGSFAMDLQEPLEEEMSRRFEYMGATYVSTLMPPISAELPWSIAVYAPENDFTGVIKANRAHNIWLAALIALATGIVGLVLANYIHKPVRAFAVRASLVSQGEVSASAPMPKTYRELERANATLVQAIVERKKTESEFGRTFDLASRGMAQIEAGTGRLIRVNAKFAQMLGYSATDILKLNIRDICHPDDPVADVFCSGQDMVQDGDLQEKRYVQRTGDVIWVSESVIVIRDEDGGAPIHAMVTADDITQRKGAERKIRQLNRDLSHSARVNVMGQMATSLAHELNQPLSAITQNMDAAVSALQHKKIDDPDLATILEETDRQAHRAGGIIKALRGFVRKDGTEKAEFDVVELIEQTLDLVRPEAKENAIAIRTSSAALLPVYGSRVQIAQVLVNLLRNAIEAIADSEVEERRINVKARNDDNGVLICVEDTGPGVDQSLAVFEQFETSKEDGMGLGLSICRTIIDAHGGRLWYQTSYNGYAEFCFTVPALLPRKPKETPDE